MKNLVMRLAVARDTLEHAQRDIRLGDKKSARLELRNVQAIVAEVMLELSRPGVES